LRTLGVDWGRARVGVAVSDETGLLSRPVGTVREGSQAGSAEAVAKLAAREGAAEIVVGLPLNMDGTEGDSARSARAFGEALKTAAGLPVVFWDERLSSVEGERLGREGGRPRGKTLDKDQAAACVLLQRYLDARRRGIGS
jgi:putative holliday junction resolvase